MLAVTADGRAIVIDPAKGEAIEGAGWVRAAPDQKARPGNLIFFTFLLGAGAALAAPAWQAIVPALVAREDLTGAGAL